MDQHMPRPKRSVKSICNALPALLRPARMRERSPCLSLSWGSGQLPWWTSDESSTVGTLP